MKKLFKCMFAILVAMSLTACSNSGDGTTEQDSIKIGLIGPLEGSAAIYGTAVYNGAQLAIDDFNEKGTLLGKKVELVAYDSKAEQVEAVNAFNKLVDQDKVAAIVGAVTSGESVAIATASQSVGIPIMSPSATVDSFTKIGDNIFRGCYTDPYQAKVLGEYAYDTLGLRSIAIIYNAGSDYSIGLTENFRTAFVAKGGTIVAEEAYAKDDKDFNTQLTKIKNTNPDGIVIPDYYETISLVASQARAMGIESLLLGGDGWDGILSMKNIDTTALEGSVFVNHYSPEDPLIQTWATRYKEKYGIEPNAFAFLAYDTTNVILQAITEAESTDYAKVNEKLKSIQFEGVLGHLEFDENGETVKDVGYVTIKNGAYATHK